MYEHANEVAMPDTPVWMEERKRGVGASEIGAICGLSDWDNAFTLWLQKTGAVSGKPVTDDMIKGKILESAIQDLWKLETGRKVTRYPVPMYCLDEAPHIRCTPDADADEDDLLECKVTTFKKAKLWGEEGTDEIPDLYRMQAQQQLLVSGARCVHVLCYMSGELKQYRVDPDERVQDEIRAAADEFWQYVVNNEVPNIDWKHPATLPAIRRQYKQVSKKHIQLGNPATVAVHAFKALDEQIKSMSKSRDMWKAQLLAAMGNAATAELPNGVTLKRTEVPEGISTKPRKTGGYIRLTISDKRSTP